MKAMCLADSGCIQKGCSRDVFDRLGCGYFRMNIWQFKQCYEPGRQIGEDSGKLIGLKEILIVIFKILKIF